MSQIIMLIELCSVYQNLHVVWYCQTISISLWYEKRKLNYKTFICLEKIFFFLIVILCSSSINVYKTNLNGDSIEFYMKIGI